MFDHDPFLWVLLPLLRVNETKIVLTKSDTHWSNDLALVDVTDSPRIHTFQADLKEGESKTNRNWPEHRQTLKNSFFTIKQKCSDLNKVPDKKEEFL